MKLTFWIITVLNVKKCICWCLSIIELKNARWNIEISCSFYVIISFTQNSTQYYNKVNRVVCFLPGNSPASEFLTPIRLWRWNRQCSETSKYKIQTPGNYPEEIIQHSERGESLKSRRLTIIRISVSWVMTT